MVSQPDNRRLIERGRYRVQHPPGVMQHIDLAGKYERDRPSRIADIQRLIVAV